MESRIGNTRCVEALRKQSLEAVQCLAPASTVFHVGAISTLLKLASFSGHAAVRKSGRWHMNRKGLSYSFLPSGCHRLIIAIWTRGTIFILLITAYTALADGGAEGSLDEDEGKTLCVTAEMHVGHGDYQRKGMDPQLPNYYLKKSRSLWSRSRGRRSKILGMVWPRKEQVRWYYTVSGQFMCGDRQSYGEETTVKLLSYVPLRKAVTMDKREVSQNGTFCMSKYAELTTLPNPYLHIYTKCNNNGNRCARRWRVPLPIDYLDAGYFFGALNLYTRFPGEDTSCNH